jgi:hypothetical protein
MREYAKDQPGLITLMRLIRYMETLFSSRRPACGSMADLAACTRINRGSSRSPSLTKASSSRRRLRVRFENGREKAGTSYR